MKRTPLRRTKRGLAVRSKKNSSLHRKLTDVCRRIVVEIRDQNTCQMCGKTIEQTRIEWAHVVTRNAKSLIFVPWNSLALCGPRINSTSCHNWWHTNPVQANLWWADKFPDRAEKLTIWRHDRHKPKINRMLELLWLQQEEQRLAGKRTHDEREQQHS